MISFTSFLHPAYYSAKWMHLLQIIHNLSPLCTTNCDGQALGLDRMCSRREPSVSRRETTVSRRETTVSRREPSVSRRETTVSRRETTVSRREPSVSRKRAVSVTERAVSVTERAESFQEVLVCKKNALLIIINVSVKRNILSIETILSAYTRVHTQRHPDTRALWPFKAKLRSIQPTANGDWRWMKTVAQNRKQDRSTVLGKETLLGYIWMYLNLLERDAIRKNFAVNVLVAVPLAVIDGAL